jgi:teichuronic acid biosynthesis glycosyltransferase TuaG
MVCRDGLPYLAETLRSLHGQTFREWELVFWDNGSRDGSADLVRAMGCRARVLGGAEALTLGEARRRAFEASRGRWLALLDADDLWRADKLERQTASMAREDVGLCYADCDVIAADGRTLGRYSWRARPASGRIRSALLAENVIPTCTALVAREVCDDVGGPDPDLNVAADYDLWLRVAARAQVAYDPEPLAAYRVRKGSLTGNFREAYAENRRIYRRLMAPSADGARGERERVRRALASLLWKWAVRELLEPRSPGAAARRSREAWAVAAGPGQALADLASVAIHTFRGLGLRMAMRRER